MQVLEILAQHKIITNMPIRTIFKLVIGKHTISESVSEELG